MAHIHELIDFTVVAFIVYQDKILLIHHKELDKWLPIGGHIELDEDPEEALFREVREESGLGVEVLGEKPSFRPEGRKFLYSPTFMEIHNITKTHRHVTMVYFARAQSSEVKLADKEHHEIRWFSKEELDNPKFNLQPDIKFYAREAFKRVS